MMSNNLFSLLHPLPRSTAGVLDGHALRAFRTSLGDMVNVPQWHLFRLEFNAVTGRFNKTPCGFDGRGAIKANEPQNWHSFDTVMARVLELDTQLVGGPLRYAVGFRLTTQAGFFLLDIDTCIQDGVPSDLAIDLCKRFDGALCELSSSGRGLHIVARCPPILHARQCKKEHIELYTDGQSIAFGVEYLCAGSASKSFEGEIAALARQFFAVAERAVVTVQSGGAITASDKEVLTLARSDDARRGLRGAPPFDALFEHVSNELDEDASEGDFAVARLLARGTRDAAQIERIMRTSARRRPKWDHRRGPETWLQYSIRNALSGSLSVSNDTTTGSVEIVDAHNIEQSKVLVEQIVNASSEEELLNKVAASIQSAQLPALVQPRVIEAFKKRMKELGSNLRVAQIRALLFPYVNKGIAELPYWAKSYVYVNEQDKFFDTETGTTKTPIGFRANYDRLMPVNDAGHHQNSAEASLTRWNMPTVDRIGYKPNEGSTYDWEGVKYANLYTPSSVPPTSTAYSVVGAAGINAFRAHVWAMCGARADVYNAFIFWFAHNLQHPGKKIRWAPLLKGINGDGKSLVFSVLRAAMGWRNVSATSNAVITAQSGFNDGATGAAVNIIEEIFITGKLRFHMYNAMKEMITNDTISINPKGRVAYRTHNNTNHAATSNHTDAIPLSGDDRRWFVIFTPWGSKGEMLKYCGLDEPAWSARTEAIATAMREAPGDFRKWFLEIVIPPSFDPNSEAPQTPEKRRMMASSADEIDSIAIDVIEKGGFGVTTDVLSSRSFTALLRTRCAEDGADFPKTTTLNHLLNRIGFQKVERHVKWRDQSHSIWVRNGVLEDNDAIRSILDRSIPAVQTHLPVLRS